MFGFFARPSAVEGSAAPPFTLQAHDGSTVELLAFRGKRRVVLAFYPEDDTPVAAYELKAFDAARERLAAHQALVLGISHNSIRSHVRFAEKHGLSLPLLCDTPGDVARMYGAKWLLPFFRRRTVVVDGRGVVRLVVKGMPDVDAVITFLAGLTGDLPGPEG